MPTRARQPTPRVPVANPLQHNNGIAANSVQDMVTHTTRVMSRSNHRYWVTSGNFSITHPPLLVIDRGDQTPVPGDLYVHKVEDGNRQIWICQADSTWKEIPSRTGLLNEPPEVRHPIEADWWLYFPLNGNPDWQKNATFARRSRARKAVE